MQGFHHAIYFINYSCPVGNKIDRLPSTKHLRKGEISFIIIETPGKFFYPARYES
jgi:hypothetical protein